jgi:hypothetical protein
MRRLPVFIVAVSVWSMSCVGVASAAWTAPQTIPDLASTATPAVGMDGAGNAVTVLVGAETGTGQLMSSRQPDGAGWTTPVPFSGATNAQALFLEPAPLLEVNASGAAIALWVQSSTYKSAYRAGEGMPWTVETPPTTLTGGHNPRIAIDDAGNALVGWADSVDENPDPDSSRVVASYRPAAGGWTATEVVHSRLISGGTGLTFFDVAFAGTGQGAMLYADGVTRTGAVELRSGGGAWGDHTPLPAPGATWDVATNSSDDRGLLAQMPSGALVALWKEFDISGPETRTAIRSAVKPAAAGFGAA